MYCSVCLHQISKIYRPAEPCGMDGVDPGLVGGINSTLGRVLYTSGLIVRNISANSQLL